MPFNAFLVMELRALGYFASGGNFSANLAERRGKLEALPRANQQHNLKQEDGNTI